MQGNFGFASTLLDTLKSHTNRCPVMLSSSIQATLIGRYGESDYGKSKLAGEELFFTYGQETGAPVLVYRFPNLFGKWCRPNYNSAVATSAITPPTTCPSRSMTAPPSWSYCTLTTWWRKCSTRWRVSLTAAITTV